MIIKANIKFFLTHGLILIFLLGLFSLSSCKKRRAFNEENANDSNDVATFRTETDAVIENLNEVINNQFLMRGKGVLLSEWQQENGSGICGLLLDTLKLLNSGIVTLNYTGEACKGRKRVGQVVASIIDYPLKKWKQKNCTLKVEFKALTITGATDGQTIKIDGTVFMINESGSSWYDMRYLNTATVINQVVGNDLVLTAEGKSAVINLKRRYTYTISGGDITCKLEGLGEQDGKSSLESWGETRGHSAFTNQLVEPIVWKTSCGVFAPVQGEAHLNVNGKYFELISTYGLDGNGGQFTGSGCSTSWKVTWSYKKKTNKRIFSYLR